MKIYDQIVVVIFLNLYVGPAYERDTIYVLSRQLLFQKFEIVIFIRMFCKSAVKNENNYWWLDSYQTVPGSLQHIVKLGNCSFCLGFLQMKRIAKYLLLSEFFLLQKLKCISEYIWFFPSLSDNFQNMTLFPWLPFFILFKHESKLFRAPNLVCPLCKSPTKDR